MSAHLSRIVKIKVSAIIHAQIKAVVLTVLNRIARCAQHIQLVKSPIIVHKRNVPLLGVKYLLVHHQTAPIPTNVKPLV